MFKLGKCLRIMSGLIKLSTWIWIQVLKKINQRFGFLGENRNPTETHLLQALGKDVSSLSVIYHLCPFDKSPIV